MSMNKYISGIINCLDTVPSLKKKLVQVLKAMDTKYGKVSELECTDIITGASVSATALGNHILLSNNTVMIMLGLDSVTATANTAIAKLPADISVKYDIRCNDANGTADRNYTITSAGVISCNANLSNAYVRICITFIHK